jgi:hypothetical protein
MHRWNRGSKKKSMGSIRNNDSSSLKPKDKLSANNGQGPKYQYYLIITKNLLLQDWLWSWLVGSRFV